jgi:hypothetical protein
MPVDPACGHSDEDLQYHGGSSGWRHQWSLTQHTTNLRRINTVASADYFNTTGYRRGHYVTDWEGWSTT